MPFSIDNYDIYNYINNEPEDEINLGISYLKLDAHRSLEIELTSPSSFILRGETYFMLGKFNEALIDFNKAFEINPNNEIYFEIPIICNPESLVHSKNALQKLINTLLFHEESFYSLKQFDKALLYNDKVLEIDRKVYYSLGQYYKAILDLNKALENNPLDMATLFYRVEIYFNQGHYDKAFSDLENVLEQYDEDLYNLGMSLEIRSNYTNTLILQAKICFNLEKFSDTIQFLSKALEIDPKNKIILTLRGKAFYCLGCTHEAFVDFNEALKIEPNNIYMLILFGEAYLNLEHYYNVHSDFDKAIKILPTHMITLMFQSKIKVFEIEPNNETTVKYLIDAFNGYDFTSIKHFMIKGSKKFEINNMLCGEEYSRRRQFDYALLYFNKVLKISPNDKKH
ncbi:hypothetical protein C2G38_2159296 [Gigaspora rosea]|uniref:Uncharacterized protein n=1 Tax=Gigaspora rosea TaxID=44941 RepID=A0A397W952_9GLOM|nr:hypothetical protein C2G38_2159296 [Gigaspora rosea]